MNNTRLVIHTLFAIFCATLIQTKSFAEPLNLNEVRESLRAYHDSGLYDKEVAAVAAEAQNYILREAKLNALSHQPKKLAIVLDVDETSLSYYDSLSKKNFCYDPVASRENILNEGAPAVKPILALYQDAIKHQISVFFITARRTHLYGATARNLKKAGFDNWTGLYTRPNHYKDKQISRAQFKTEIRALITKQGYTIIASIGDQLSDLSGGYAKKTFKLPNPFYFIP